MTEPVKKQFIKERKTEPRNHSVDTRGMLSIATMLVSMSALTISMLGAAKLVVDVFNDGLAVSMDGILVKVMVLGFAFLFGWVTGLACIRAFGNLVYPYIVTLYSWACLAAVGLLYIKVIQKLYLQQYDGLHFGAYLVMLLGGLFVLICLHLLLEDHDLRPFAIPLLIISVLQLFVIVFRYVFNPVEHKLMVLGDFTIFLVMISIAALMLMHIGILSPLRDQISYIFNSNQSSSKEADKIN